MSNTTRYVAVLLISIAIVLALASVNLTGFVYEHGGIENMPMIRQTTFPSTEKQIPVTEQPLTPAQPSGGQPSSEQPSKNVIEQQKFGVLSEPDTTPPNTTALYDNGAYTPGTPTTVGGLSVNLTCTDNPGGSGCNRTKCCGGFSPCTPNTVNCASINANAPVFFCYNSTDNENNNETVKCDYLILAQPPVSDCMTIDYSGYSILTQNITYSGSGSCIDIQSNDVALVCNGHTINGSGSGIGINVNGYQNTTIRNCTVTNFQYGIYLDTSSNNTFVNNTANNNTNYGIALSHGSNNTITNNTFNNNQVLGIYLNSGSNNNTFTNNRVDNNLDTGFLASSSSYNNLTGNTFNNNTWIGIHLDSDSNNNTITNNTFNNNQYYGIWLTSNSNNTLTNNTACMNSNTDIVIASSSNSGDNVCNTSSMDGSTVTCNTLCPVCGNEIIETGEVCDGTDLNGQTCQSLGYTSGTLECNSTCGVNTSGCYNATPLTNCTTINSLGAYNGLYYLANNVSANGTCFDIQTRGITLDCNGHSITGNGTGNGINLECTGSSAYNTVINNCTIKNFHYGIYLGGQSTAYYYNSRIINNTILNNYYGIWLRMHQGAHLIDNNFTNNTWGINVFKGISTNNEIRNNRVCGNTKDIEIGQSTGNYGDNICDILINNSNPITCNTLCSEQACCFSSGSCQVLLPGNCTIAGGTSNGALTCSPNSCPQPDVDGDGIPDASDNCITVYNPDQNDTDQDSIGDACDNCPLISNSNQVDTDHDGIGDVCDVCPTDPTNDADGDGICGMSDNCPITYNPNQNDADQDGVGDLCDNCLNIYNPDQNDTDHDGIGDTCDNCPAVYNPDQNDTNQNGIGDSCDCNSGDGLCTASAYCISQGTPDSDCPVCGDGIIETGEVCDGSNLGSQTCASVLGQGYNGTLTCNSSCAFDISGCFMDADGDGVPDNQDNCPTVYNPDQNDTDVGAEPLSQLIFTINHADCSSGASQFDFYLNDVYLGTRPAVVDCNCNDIDVNYTFDDQTTLAAYNLSGSNKLQIVWGSSLYVAYVTATGVFTSGNVTINVFGDSSILNLCNNAYEDNGDKTTIYQFAMPDGIGDACDCGSDGYCTAHDYCCSQGTSDHDCAACVYPPTCGSTITSNTTLISGINQCSGDGLIIGANNITLDCNGTTITGSGSGTGIFAEGRTDITIMNCNVSNWNTGIKLNDTNDSQLLNNNVHNNYNNIYLTNSNNNVLDGNIAHATTSGHVPVGGYGIYLTSSSGNIIRNNIAVIDEIGILISGGTGNNLTNNTAGFFNQYAGPLRNYWAGIVLNDSNGNNLTNNTANYNNYFGIAIGWYDMNNPSISYPSNNSILTNNNASNNVQIGIVISGDQNTITGSTVNSNGVNGSNTEGILLIGNHNNITGNNITSNGGSSFYSSGIHFSHANSNTVQYNLITQNANGIYFYGPAGPYNNNIITYNRLYGNVNYDASWESYQPGSINDFSYNYWGRTYCQGFRLTGGPFIESIIPYYTDYDMTNLDYNTFCGCGSMIMQNTTLNQNVTGCSGLGLFINANNVTLDCNGHEISGSGSSDGIAIMGRSGVTIKNCTVSNFGNGINIQLGSTNNNIISNIIFNNYQNGIYLQSGSNYNNIRDNTVHDSLCSTPGICYGGIWINGSSNNNITNNNVYNNSFVGILIFSSSNNNIINDNTISTNLNPQFGGFGIVIGSSNDNQVYTNNFIDNPIQALAVGGTTTGNAFNSGMPAGGNYWSDYHTPAQGCYDSDADGFCDAPYNNITDGQGHIMYVDNYPWTRQMDTMSATMTVAAQVIQNQYAIVNSTVTCNKPDGCGNLTATLDPMLPYGCNWTFDPTGFGWSWSSLDSTWCNNICGQPPFSYPPPSGSKIDPTHCICYGGTQTDCNNVCTLINGIPNISPPPNAICAYIPNQCSGTDNDADTYSTNASDANKICCGLSFNVNCSIGVDCNDSNMAVHPGTTEICNNGMDDNCNGLIDCADLSCATNPVCTVKGVIPKNSGTPFYTINNNPQTSADVPCLANLSYGHSCNVTWTINATGQIGKSYTFFVTYTSDKVPSVSSPSQLVTITSYSQTCGNSITEGTEVCDSNAINCTTQQGYAGTQNCNSTCSGWDTCKSTDYCGDSIINGLEVCDNANLSGQTCISQGNVSGTLTCASNCSSFNTSNCVGLKTTETPLGTTPILPGQTFELPNGGNVILGMSDTVTFTVHTALHQGKVRSVGTNSITIEFSSDPIAVTVNTGETKDVDLTGDSIADISVYLEKVVSGKAYVTITSIEILQAPVVKVPTFLPVLQPFCGDSICSNSETTLTCLLDCPPTIVYAAGEGAGMGLLSFEIIAAIVLVVIITFLKRKVDESEIFRPVVKKKLVKEKEIKEILLEMSRNKK